MDRGTPDLAFKGLSLWATARAYPDASDSWDAELISCPVLVEANGARVEINIVTASREFHAFLGELIALYEKLNGEASLNSTDSDLLLTFEATATGQISAKVVVTPDYVQRHEFVFAGDQTELMPVLSQCRRLLERFPVLIKLPD